MIEFVTVWVILVLDPIAAFILIAVTTSSRTLKISSAWPRLGMLVTASGLLGQAARNLVFVLTGHSPSDLEMPFWVLKDIGLVILALHFGFLAITRKSNGR